MLKVIAEPTPLPMKRVPGTPKEEAYIKMQAVKLLSSIRKLTIAHSEEEVIKVLTIVRQHGYSGGLKDMDAMHKSI